MKPDLSEKHYLHHDAHIKVPAYQILLSECGRRSSLSSVYLKELSHVQARAFIRMKDALQREQATGQAELR